MKINRVLQVLIILVLPFLFLMSAVRVLITPGYAAFEYQRSWFPKDPYGMSKDERLVWSRYAINYLTNDEDISYLGDCVLKMIRKFLTRANWNTCSM